MSGHDCPSWHFLAGPMQTDEERTECPRRDDHAEMRRRYESAREIERVSRAYPDGVHTREELERLEPGRRWTGEPAAAKLGPMTYHEMIHSGPPQLTDAELDAAIAKYEGDRHQSLLLQVRDARRAK